MQLEALIPQVDTIIRIYGNVERIEKVDEKKYGESFLQQRFITYHTSGAPLFWDMKYFRNKEEWQVYVFGVNDQFDAVFGSQK